MSSREFSSRLIREARAAREGRPISLAYALPLHNDFPHLYRKASPQLLERVERASKTTLTVSLAVLTCAAAVDYAPRAVEHARQYVHESRIEKTVHQTEASKVYDLPKEHAAPALLRYDPSYDPSRSLGAALPPAPTYSRQVQTIPLQRPLVAQHIPEPRQEQLTYTCVGSVVQDGYLVVESSHVSCSRLEDLVAKYNVPAEYPGFLDDDSGDSYVFPLTNGKNC